MSKENTENTQGNGDLAVVMEQFSECRLIYAPKSIHHGEKLGGVQIVVSEGRKANFSYGMHSHSKETLMRIEMERMNDFIEYLFEHSEHCDHISQNEAWMEFSEWEAKENSP